MTDHLGSVRDIVDDNGTLRKHVQYDSFGNIIDEDYFDTAGDPIAAVHAEAIAQLFGYTGRPFDKTTGLQNNLHRWYDPTVGRWLSEDPIGFAAGDANLYRYVGNVATEWVDPYGLNPAVPATWLIYPALPGAAVAFATPALVVGAGVGGYKVGEAIDDAGYNPLTPLAVGLVNGYYWLFPNTGTRVTRFSEPAPNPREVSQRQSQRREEIGLKNKDPNSEIPTLKPGKDGGWGKPANPNKEPVGPKPPKPRHNPGERGDHMDPKPPVMRNASMMPFANSYMVFHEGQESWIRSSEIAGAFSFSAPTVNLELIISAFAFQSWTRELIWI